MIITRNETPRVECVCMCVAKPQPKDRQSVCARLVSVSRAKCKTDSFVHDVVFVKSEQEGKEKQKTNRQRDDDSPRTKRRGRKDTFKEIG